MVHEVENVADFKAKLVEAADKLVVVDFYASWCGPCKRIAPHVLKLSQEMSDIVFLKVNVNALEDLAEEYKVERMPTFVFIKNGETLHSYQDSKEEMLDAAIAQYK